jgi:hypothetical protein
VAWGFAEFNDGCDIPGFCRRHTEELGFELSIAAAAAQCGAGITFVAAGFLHK